jgi:GT2 family glycosyltransferase
VISLVLVSYRSAALASEAIASVRAAAAALGEELEVVTVVNSGDAAEVAALGPLSDRLVAPESNRGFAGGLNCGIAEAKGDVLALANPDVALSEAALAALLDVLKRHDRAAVGPVFFWDDACTLLLPAAEEPRPAELVRRLLASSGERGARVFRRDLARARRETARALSGETARVTGLTGALVLARRVTLDAVGPFDEGYPLYYEENDWQRRLRILGGVLLRAGAARVVHRFNQSARFEPRSAEWFARSERRYFLSHFGPRGARALETLAGAKTSERRLLELRGSIRFPSGAHAVVLSPYPWFRPFAYAEVAPSATSWEVPADVLAGLEGTWCVRAVDGRGETLAEGRFIVNRA